MLEFYKLANITIAREGVYAAFSMDFKRFKPLTG
jgi:hypothetical protein